MERRKNRSMGQKVRKFSYDAGKENTTLFADRTFWWDDNEHKKQHCLSDERLTQR